MRLVLDFLPMSSHHLIFGLEIMMLLKRAGGALELLPSSAAAQARAFLEIASCSKFCGDNSYCYAHHYLLSTLPGTLHV